MKNEVRLNIKALMMKLNKPNVKKLIGKVSSNKIGLTNKLSMAKTTLAIKAVTQPLT